MNCCIVWLRKDLRTADNPALHAAVDAGHLPVPVYVHDDPDPHWPLGSASAWWLHHSLIALRAGFQKLGSDLLILRGDSATQLQLLAERTGAVAVFWNRCYEPALIQRDRALKEDLASRGLQVRSFAASLLREPWEHTKKDSSPYRVFTPFYKALLARGPSREVLGPIERLPPLPPKAVDLQMPVEALELLPQKPWDTAFYPLWQPGENGAWKQLNAFLDHHLQDYPIERDLPCSGANSRLSPALHFGEISPLQIQDRLAQELAQRTNTGFISATDSFLRQLAWREFSYHLLYHFPSTSLKPLDPRFEQFPWQENYTDMLRRWQQGMTGIPLVDAGMRELWETGYMHNRVRMVTASFLTKNLLIPWQEGARWFWDTLLDADLANNTAGWQWVAGSGADAAPYFRVFNPVLQGEKFDRQGQYVRRWIPELRSLPDKWVHQPWMAGEKICSQAGCSPGVDYPAPVINLKTSRAEALQAWSQVKQPQGQR